MTTTMETTNEIFRQLLEMLGHAFGSRLYGA